MKINKKTEVDFFLITGSGMTFKASEVKREGDVYIVTQKDFNYEIPLMAVLFLKYRQPEKPQRKEQVNEQTQIESSDKAQPTGQES